MASAIISVVLTLLSNKLIKETSFLRNVRSQFKQLEKELKRIECLLKDADDMEEGNGMIRNWVSEIREVSYDTQDVIETFILKIEEEDRKKKTTTSKGFKATLSKINFPGILGKGKKFYSIGKEIKVIHDKLSELKKDQYPIQLGLGELRKKPKLDRRTSSVPDVEDFIGLEDNVNTLVKKLTGSEVNRLVISIVGMGGLGKTTLARYLYNHNEIQSHFDYCGWISVSQECKIEDLLRTIINSIIVRMQNRDDEKKMSMTLTINDLELWLYDLLEHHRYLLVIDDVWDMKAWNGLKKALRDKKNGSRVLLTTRNKGISLRIDPRTAIHELRFLNTQESWELFCKKAFPVDNYNGGGMTYNHRPYLEAVGKEMVGKCGGLPLGVIVMGGLLSKRLQSKVLWRTTLNPISQMLMEDQDHHLSQILALSYHDLPYESKPCFLYTALFPKGSAIEKTKLIQLWMAEGFIPQGKEPMEDAAEDKLKELSDRCIFQVLRKKNSWKDKGCSFSIHDLLWDLAITTAKAERFLQIYEKEDSASSSARPPQGRRFAIHSENDQSCVSLQTCLPPKLRSLVISNRSSTTEFLQNQLKYLFTGFKFLRVLDLGFSKLDGEPSLNLPKEIGNMIHLRYLGLRNTYIKELPTSIGNLQRLQTLDVTTSYFDCTLPDSVGRLGQLRHLYGCWSKMTPQIDSMTNLRTLDCIDFNAWKKNDPSKFINLLELKITGIESTEDMSALSESLHKMGNNLHSLSVRMAGKQYNPQSIESTEDMFALSESLGKMGNNLQSLSMAGKQYNPQSIELPGCENLLELDITCHLERLPYLLEYSPNLTHLGLHNTYLEEDPMPTLEMLENLSVLYLESAYTGAQMICSACGFPNLESLSISLMFELMGWTVVKGAMPGIRQLNMSCLPALQEVPEGFEFLTSLQELQFKDMSKFLEEKLRGEESYKVQHIPSVTFSQSNDNVSEDEFDQVTNLLNFEVLHFLATKL